MSPKQQGYWKHGQRRRIAELADISDAHLSDVLHRRRGVSLDVAKRLEAASGEVLGVRIPWETWMCNKQSNHPCLEGKPVAKGS